MRRISMPEAKKRGCHYCRDCQTGKRLERMPGFSNILCFHDICPYHELNKYRKYKDYLDSKESQICIDVIIPRLKKRKK